LRFGLRRRWWIIYNGRIGFEGRGSGGKRFYSWIYELY
jgi:hypothetical protein